LERSAILKYNRPQGQKMNDMTQDAGNKHEGIIKEIIALERDYFFEKRNVKTERQRKLKEIIEKHTKLGDEEDGS